MLLSTADDEPAEDDSTADDEPAMPGPAGPCSIGPNLAIEWRVDVMAHTGYV